MKIKKMSLISKLIIASIAGILIGNFMPLWFCRTITTLSGFFSSFLKFIIPLMILSYVTIGIADLSQGAGKLLFITMTLTYGSTLISGVFSFLVSSRLFKSFMSPEIINKIQVSDNSQSVKALFELVFPPVLDTISSVVLSFIFGLWLSSIKNKNSDDSFGKTLYSLIKDLSIIINNILNKIIVPLLPIYICGTFIDMTYSGKTFAVLNILWKVFLVVIFMHVIILLTLFFIAGIINKKNPFLLIKNQLPGYTAAFATQSSMAAIPVNLKCAEKNGIREEIRNFIVPICANIHMPGSMITITACAVAVCLIYKIPVDLSKIISFIMTLAIAMTASPGAPGGSIMTALPFLYMIFGKEAGDTNGPLCAIMIALYITQDSFGTACNVSADNAVGLIVNFIYDKYIKKQKGD